MPSRRATDDEAVALASGQKVPAAVEDEKPDDDFQSPLDPGVAEKVAAALSDSVKIPDPAATPPDCGVILPAGVQRGDHTVTTATVRELTGVDEEVLGKAIAAKPGNIFHFLNILLECGVERFGSEDVSQTKKLLRNALVGDRDALIIGISRATYGEEIELKEWICPSCEEKSDLVIPLDDIPIRDFEGDYVVDIPLKNGRKAEVRLANGADQLSIFADDRATPAERDTALISRCLISLTDADGTNHQAAGFAASHARNLPAPDRHKIIKTLNDKQPGPQFSGLKITHETCSEEVDVLIGISDLFPGLRMV